MWFNFFNLFQIIHNLNFFEYEWVYLHQLFKLEPQQITNFNYRYRLMLVILRDIRMHFLNSVSSCLASGSPKKSRVDCSWQVKIPDKATGSHQPSLLSVQRTFVVLHNAKSCLRSTMSKELGKFILSFNWNKLFYYWFIFK